MGLGNDMSETLKQLELMLETLPGPVRGAVVEKIRELRKLILDQRAPRFALVGRRGSGKSSLINAVFGRPVSAVGHETAMTGEARWERYEGDLGMLDILDTRGLQEGSKPDEADDAVSPEASILAALEDVAPDAFLFLVKATEADAAIDGDLAALASITDRVAAAHGFRLPLVAVLTQCDVVEPKNVQLAQPDDEDPEDLEEKRERIQRICAHLRSKLRDRPALRGDLVRVVPVSAYMSWRRDGAIRADERWNIDELLTYLLDELPEEAKVDLVRLSQVAALQTQIARRIVNACVVISGGIAMTPIPVADLLPLTALQLKMVTMVGYVGGRKLDARAVGEFVAGLGMNVAVGAGMRELARALLKLLPGAGSVASAAVASAGTKGLGEAAIAYFINGQDLTGARRRYLETKDAEQAASTGSPTPDVE